MRGSGPSWQGFGDGDQPAPPRPADWLAAQSALAADLAGAALAVGRLEARLSLAFVLTLLITPVIYVLIEGLRRKPEAEATPVAAE